MFLKRTIVENPLWLHLPQQHASRCLLRQNRACPNVECWNANFSRLYARRMLELLAGSAAFYSLNNKGKTSADALLAEARNITKPSDWLSYHENQKDWTKEMMDSLGTSSISRWTIAFGRLVNLGLLASPLLIMAPLSFIPTPTLFSSSKNEEESGRRSHSIFHDLMWDYMLFAIDAAGPTFIKFVQWATTRQDLFSQEFCSHFGKLHDSTRGHSWNFTVDLLEKELGKDWKSLMQIEPEPVGSGCIAQVYKGILQESTPTMPKGSAIAIKVQHPNIWDKVCADFFILQHIANAFESIPFLNLDYLSVRDTVDQFAQAMLPQLDLVLEGKHLQRFSRNFADNPQVDFPIPVEELTTSKVLVESFCEGTPILKYGKDKDQKTKEELAMLGLNTTLTMIFLHDFVHGDLHPGNILVRRHPETGQLCMTMLDCGLVIEFGPEQHETVVKILGAFIRRQGRDAGQLMVDTTKVKTNNPVDIERFINGIERIIVEDAEQGNRVKLEAAFINCALSMEIMEGIASTLFPKIEVVSTAMPLVVKAEMMHRLPFSWSKYRTT